MSHDEIKQRIQYLVEHGGLYDEPLAAAVVVGLLTGLELTLIALD
jgi:hypothetical protein